MAGTFTVVELPTSGSITKMKPGEVSSLSLVSLVQGSTGTTSADLYNYWTQVLFRCPKTFRWTADTQLYSYVLAAVEITPVPDAAYKWIVRETFTTRDGCTCLAKVTRSAGARIVDRFRVVTVPTSTTIGAFPPTSSEMIAGTPIDMRGTPQKYPVVTQNIVVETMYEAAYVKSNTSLAWPDYQSIATSAQFKRNSASFLGWNAGQVVFMGMDESPVDDLWRMCTWRFVADNWYHLEQRAAPEANGKVLVADTSTWADGTVMMHASKVLWYQPYPSTFDFMTLFDTCVQNELSNPKPAWPVQ